MELKLIYSKLKAQPITTKFFFLLTEIMLIQVTQLYNLLMTASIMCQSGETTSPHFFCGKLISRTLLSHPVIRTCNIAQ